MSDKLPTQTVLAKRIGDGRIVSVGGKKMFLREGGEGEPLLLIPGSFLSNRAWLRFAPLVHHRMHTIAVDPVGVGKTSKVRAPRDMAFNAQAALLCQLLDALGIERAHVIGAGYGGNIALTLAGLYPNRIRSVIAIESPYLAPNHEWIHHVRGGLEVLRFGRVGFWIAVRSGLLARSWTRELLGRRSQTAPEGKKHTVFECFYDPSAYYRGWWSLLRAPIDDPSRALTGITAPLLFLQGADSPLHGQLDRMHEMLLRAQPSLQWETIPLGEHDVAIQLPALVADAALKFWDELGKAK